MSQDPTSQAQDVKTENNDGQTINVKVRVSLESMRRIGMSR